MVFGIRLALLLGGLAIVLLAGPGNLAAAQDTETPARDKSLDDRIDAIERSTERQMEDAKKAAREALDRLRQGYGELKERASKEWEERRPEYERRLAEAEQRLDDLAGSAAEKWEETRQAAAKSLRDLSDWLDSYGGKNGNEDLEEKNLGDEEKPADTPKNI